MKNSLFRQILYTYILGFSVLMIVVFLKIFSGFSLNALTTDIAEYAEIHPFTGILSTFGILLWCASVSILIFSAFALFNHVSRSVFLFLLSSAIITGYLLIDDIFMIHEKIAPNFGVDETIMYFAIIIVAIIYFITFFRLIFSSNKVVFFLISVSFLGISLISDTALLKPYILPLGDWRYLFEEGTKWLGIASWTSYFTMISYMYLKDNLRSCASDIVD
jgi:hypothetical protein